MLCELWVPAFVKQDGRRFTTLLLPCSVAIAVINSPPAFDIESLWRTTGDVYWGEKSRGLMFCAFQCGFRVVSEKVPTSIKARVLINPAHPCRLLAQKQTWPGQFGMSLNDLG
jgi:hypothetical protein